MQPQGGISQGCHCVDPKLREMQRVVLGKLSDSITVQIQNSQDHRMTYKRGSRRTQVDYILWRQCNLKEISDHKLAASESVNKKHKRVLRKIIIVVKKIKRTIVQTAKR